MDGVNWKNIPKAVHDAIAHLAHRTDENRSRIDTLTETVHTMDFENEVSFLKQEIEHLKVIIGRKDLLADQYYSTIDKFVVKFNGFKKIFKAKRIEDTEKLDLFSSNITESEKHVKAFVQDYFQHMEKKMNECIDQNVSAVNSEVKRINRARNQETKAQELAEKMSEIAKVQERIDKIEDESNRKFNSIQDNITGYKQDVLEVRTSLKSTQSSINQCETEIFGLKQSVENLNVSQKAFNQNVRNLKVLFLDNQTKLDKLIEDVKSAEEIHKQDRTEFLSKVSLFNILLDDQKMNLISYINSEVEHIQELIKSEDKNALFENKLNEFKVKMKEDEKIRELKEKLYKLPSTSKDKNKLFEKIHKDTYVPRSRLRNTQESSENKYDSPHEIPIKTFSFIIAKSKSKEHNRPPSQPRTSKSTASILQKAIKYNQ